MNAMNVLPLQVTVAATLATVAVALWAGSGGGLRGAIRRAVLLADRVSSTLATVLASLVQSVRTSHESGIDVESATASPASPNKSGRDKYACPCMKQVWGKPGLKLICGDCGCRFEVSR